MNQGTFILDVSMWKLEHSSSCPLIVACQMQALCDHHRRPLPIGLMKEEKKFFQHLDKGEDESQNTAFTNIVS